MNYFVITWKYSYLFLYFFLCFFVLSLILRRVPYFYILGRRGFILFMVSFVSWGTGYFYSFIFIVRFYIRSKLFLLFFYLFDVFVVYLRPLTLCLRVFINVSLGHFVIIFLHLRIYLNLLFFWLFELFVYVVQSYVFLALSISYFNILFWVLSLVIECLPYEEEGYWLWPFSLIVE